LVAARLRRAAHGTSGRHGCGCAVLLARQAVEGLWFAGEGPVRMVRVAFAAVLKVRCQGRQKQRESLWESAEANDHEDAQESDTNVGVNLKLWMSVQHNSRLN
jgi:hypothetical protein